MNQEQHSANNDPWRTDTHNARRRVQEEILNIPEWVPGNATVNVPREVVYLHKTVIDYASHIAPKADDLADLWTEEVCTFPTPVPGSEYDAGYPNDWGEVNTDGAVFAIPWTGTELTLEALVDEWLDGKTVEFHVLVRGEGGTQRQQRRKTLYLPPRASKRAYGQLNRCLDELGWTSESEKGDSRPTYTTKRDPDEYDEPFNDKVDRPLPE